MFAVLAGRRSSTVDWLAKVASVLEVEPWRLLVESADTKVEPRKPGKAAARRRQGGE